MVRSLLSIILLNSSSDYWACWNSFKGTHSGPHVKCLLLERSSKFDYSFNYRRAQLMSLKGSSHQSFGAIIT